MLLCSIYSSDFVSQALTQIFASQKLLLCWERYTLCLRNNGVCEMKRVGEEEIIGKVSSQETFFSPFFSSKSLFYNNLDPFS